MKIKEFLNACWKGNLEEVKQLLNNGIDVNAKDDEDGTTALMIVCWKGYKVVDSNLLLKMKTDKIAKIAHT